MRVLITGGTGHIGRATTDRLLKNGWEVRIVDLAAEAEIAGAEYVQCDILQYDSLLEPMRGCDAVIHLAAIRSPNLAPGHQVFQVNVQGTFNVFEAAAVAGIRRVVQASSINALGAYWNTVEIEPQYFPIDEDHPRITTDPYSFSKQVIEDIGDYYWRRDGISSVAMRFPGVYSQGFTKSDSYQQRRTAVRNLLHDFLSQPESAQRAQIVEVQKRVLEFRAGRPFEFHPGDPPATKNPLYDDPMFRLYISERSNYWAFIDERDAAQSLEKGVTADYEGAHPLFINAANNAYDLDSQMLIDIFFADVQKLKRELSGSESLISIERARQLIGYEPEYSVSHRA
jgi:hypothetical protein